MITTMIIALMLQGEPQTQRDTTTTTTTEQNDAPRRKVNIVIKLPGMKIPLYV